MGATVIADTDYRAFVEPDGGILIFSFHKSHEKNTWPRSDRWRMTAADRIEDTIRRIGRDCVCIEDGILQLADGANGTELSDARFYAEQQLAALRRPVPLAELPKTTTIVDPGFDNWQWRGFESQDDMRARFEWLLKSSGIKTDSDRTIRVDQNIDLLLSLDRFAPCHDAWPRTRMPSDHAVTPLEAPLSGPAQHDRMHALPIDGLRNLFLVVRADHQDPPGDDYETSSPDPIVTDGLGALKCYWHYYFPYSSVHESWPDDHANIERQINHKGTSFDPGAVLLQMPQVAGQVVVDLWREGAGDDARVVSLEKMASNFNKSSPDSSEWKTARLAMACDVVTARPDPYDCEHEDESEGPR